MLNARIMQKHDTQENWDKAVNFIPKAGEIIVYDADDTYSFARVKVGDGENSVGDLPFMNDYVSITNAEIDEIVGQFDEGEVAY